jgi:ribosome-associated heat shock protein Hsp15
MAELKSVRIDKFLWAVRLFKTRSLATEACKMGRILVNGNLVKPSGKIEGNELLTVRKPPVIYTYRVKALVENRVPAKLVPSCIEDLTPENEKLKLEIRVTGITGYRKKGLGRPTKKERRSIDTWQDGFSDFF